MGSVVTLPVQQSIRWRIWALSALFVVVAGRVRVDFCAAHSAADWAQRVEMLRLDLDCSHGASDAIGGPTSTPNE